jgi:heme A synthase
MSISGMFSELRSWPVKRRMVAAGVGVVAGAGLVGLVVASYFDAPIGADATLCDVRWPVLGLISLYLSTDLRTAVPMLDGVARPIVALAAIALLVWALLERLGSESRAVAKRDRSVTAGDDVEDGEVCTTCRPLFPRTQSRS